MDGMVSRITIFSALLGLMLGLGIYMYSQGERDRCNTYPADGVAPRSEYVDAGSREIEVPCSNWYIRQPLAMQVLCIADAGLGALFAVRALGDLVRWIEWRRRLARRRRGAETGP